MYDKHSPWKIEKEINPKQNIYDKLTKEDDGTTYSIWAQENDPNIAILKKQMWKTFVLPSKCQKTILK